MATGKRTQVLLREPIQKLIEELSEHEQCSASKTVSKLVEEALVARGLLQAEAVQSIQPLGLQLPPGVQVRTVTNRRTAEADQPSPWKQMEERGLTAAHIHEQVPSLREEPAPTTSQPLDNEAGDEMLELLAMAKKLKTLQKAGLL